MQQLMTIYERYAQKAEEVRKKAPPTAGLFGMGDDPRKHPCHMEFYESVEQWVKDFMETSPGPEAANEAVAWIITQAAEHREKESYWFMYAAHGLCKPLIPLMSAGNCAALAAYYDDHHPRRERMPAHKDVYKLLKKGAGRK